MSRLGRAVVVVLALIAASCAQGAASRSADLGSTPGATVVGAVPGAPVEGTLSPGVIIAPTPTPEGPRPLLVATLLAEEGSIMEQLDGTALAGVVAAIERLNEDGGVLGREVRLVRHDTDSRLSVTRRTMLTLVEQRPDVLIVSCDTAFSAPALEMAAEAGLLTISPCAADPRYLTGALGPLNFTLGAPAETQGAVAAQVTRERYGSCAIVLRDVTNPEGLAFCDGFEKAYREVGGTVVYRDEFSYDTLEPVQERLDERGRDVSAIVVCSHLPGRGAGAPAIIEMVRELAFTAPIVAGSTVDQPGWMAATPELGTLLFVAWSSAHGNDPDDRVNDVVRRAAQNGDTPGPGQATMLGADTIEAWGRAVEMAGDPSPEAVAAAFETFDNEALATGELSFGSDARMDIGRTYRVLEVFNGVVQVVGLQSTPD